MDGFKLLLRSNASGTKADSIRFLLQGRADGTQMWADIGTPRFRRVREGIRLLGGEVLPVAGEPLLFDFRAPWPLAMHEAWVPGVEALFYACLTVCAATGRAKLARRVFSALLATVGLNLAATGVGYVALSQPGEAFLPLCSAATYIAVWAIVRRSQRLLRHGLIAHGTAISLLRAASDCLVCGDCGRPEAIIDLTAILWVLCGGAMTVLSRRAAARIVRAVATDEAACAALWEPFASDAAALQALAALTAQLELHCRSSAARHLNRRLAARGGARAGARVSSVSATMLAGPLHHEQFEEPHQRGMPGTHDEARPVRSLDRLYSQALLVAPRLRARAAAWAAATARGGAIRPAAEAEAEPPSAQSAGGDTFSASGSSLAGEGLDDLIRAGLVKSPERAVEKVLVCYEGDASRVVDLCRVRIAVDDLPQAAAAIAAVAADKAVRVVRVKDGMGRSPGPAAGLRVCRR
jgi:hypothetical protein